ncbi:CubicO group peptidase (beta-lactamase class C family) [Salirhabdus euzebyi]|uniref:CubicO group peptidase (Beta-lactamase class C family) n=1 Tax=Salirhabdus euzebyi TaxID=394506 RepID=A0A841PXD3_9BACI|nr:serine hydrolase [Salirhabdus euzebyi]MBB6452674.1 CubicO group peptidase (beta-lactamase class C family) [Salirhabdus euzebyi]
MSIYQNQHHVIENVVTRECFSGVVGIKEKDYSPFVTAYGLANRTENRANDIQTRFGIASGCKLFTAIAISQLVEKNLLSFDTRLKDCLDVSFPQFDNHITVHHLLTHQSGIPDYFDEEIMDDYESLWKQVPMYLIRTGADFLPLFQNEKMMFNPGEKFHYNNAGYILLGLMVEKVSGTSFTEYVEQNIFKLCSMDTSGYFSLDYLPSNSALGYIDNRDGSWRTNVYSIPIKGGADGGAFVTAFDMISFWEALFSRKLLSESYTNILLSPHAKVKDGVHYGYGLWMNSKEDFIWKYHVMGYDPGVSFHSAYYPDRKTQTVILSNNSTGAFPVMKEIEEFYHL